MGIEKTLQRAEVFLGLDDNDLGKIAALPSCQEKAYEPEDVILRAGDEAKYLYVLKEGQVDLVMEVPAKPGQTAKSIRQERNPESTYKLIHVPLFTYASSATLHTCS